MINSFYRTKNSNLGTDSFFGLPFVLSRKNAAVGGDNKASTNVARLYLNNKYKNIALTASGHITSNTGGRLDVTISVNNGTETTELYKSTGNLKQDKDYSTVIPSGTEYIEITVYQGGTGQQMSYEVRLNSLTPS